MNTPVSLLAIDWDGTVRGYAGTLPEVTDEVFRATVKLYGTVGFKETPMLHRFLPRCIDNTYQGHRLALWLFGLLILMKGSIGLGTIFNGRSTAISADGIPLDTFTSAGEQAFVALFAAWGLSQLILNLIGLVVLVRYRALVPFMFVLLLLEHLARKGIFLILPIPRAGTPPGFFINLALVAVMIVGLALSLWKKDGAQPQA